MARYVATQMDSIAAGRLLAQFDRAAQAVVADRRAGRHMSHGYAHETLVETARDLAARLIAANVTTANVLERRQPDLDLLGIDDAAAQLRNPYWEVTVG